VVTLETERLRLREPTPEDLDALAPIFADPEVQRYTGGVVRSREYVADRIEEMRAHWRRYGVGLFAVERKADQAVLGRVGFLVWDPVSWENGLRAHVAQPYETEIGWTLGREHWGQGYATEGAIAARDWAARELGLRRLISLIQVGNEASERVAEKLGMSVERVVEADRFRRPTQVFAAAL
jgi:RimJ/RimL family protein N-acetyltransferase